MGSYCFHLGAGEWEQVLGFLQGSLLSVPNILSSESSLSLQILLIQCNVNLFFLHVEFLFLSVSLSPHLSLILLSLRNRNSLCRAGWPRICSDSPASSPASVSQVCWNSLFFKEAAVVVLFTCHWRAVGSNCRSWARCLPVHRVASPASKRFSINWVELSSHEEEKTYVFFLVF